MGREHYGGADEHDQFNVMAHFSFLTVGGRYDCQRFARAGGSARPYAARDHREREQQESNAIPHEPVPPQKRIKRSGLEED
jgi:hypothetical protein